MKILQLNPTIRVNTPLGDGETLFLIDYHINTNTIWVVRMDNGGKVKHFDSNDIRVWGNPMIRGTLDTEVQTPEYRSSYDNLLKYRRGRSKH